MAMLLTIDKLVYGGDGLARMPAVEPTAEPEQGKAVFVPFVLAGEQVEAKVAEQRPGFVRARLEQVITPSPLRAGPGCPSFRGGGRCHYQHTRHQHQLEIKTGILRENLRRL